MTFCLQRLVKERNLSFAMQFQRLSQRKRQAEFCLHTWEGGQLSFIGRTLFRNPEESAIHILVNPSYLDSTFKEFGISKGSDAAPNIAEHLEKIVSDKEAKKPLSTEGYQRFRRAVGKIMWMCQSRHDLQAFTCHC